MSTPVKKQLWRLVKSLTKSEKRNFKLFATRGGATKQHKFIQLFDIFDRADELDDQSVMRRMKLTPGKYSNAKRHLYHQLLSSLRLVHIQKEIDIELREQIDFSRILYGKGHYLDALRTLERAKAKAIDHNQDLLQLQIVEFQKLIEARHVTLSRQVHNKMDLLLNESAARSYSILTASELFNMNIQIHGRYIEKGHSRSEKERQENQAYWDDVQTARVDRATTSNTFHQKINRFQSEMWYHYIQLNFLESQESASNAVNLFTISRKMTVMDPDLYMRCIYYICLFGYLNDDLKTVVRFHERLATFLNEPGIQFNENSQRIGGVYFKLINYNLLFMKGDKLGALSFSKQLNQQYKTGDFQPAEHRWGHFLYKSAAAKFQCTQYSSALDDLNEIINMKSGVNREDLLINTRILHALCNYELRHYSLVEYHLTSLSRLLRRSRETAEVHRLTITAIRRLISSPASDRRPIYQKLLAQINEQATLPFEQKALIYLDVRQWLSLYH